ncbi:MAG: ArsR family transcriptional regulator [Acidobacteria bacterium]|nr:ArsR family transcriptional regulator [Acidobacteriota bacterium]
MKSPPIGATLADMARDDAEFGRRVIPMPKPPRRTLTEVDATFRRWLGAEYDLDALHVVLAAAAAERLDGDPCWLLMISGPGNAKTETVQSLIGAGAMVVSTVSSEAALLSATPRREKAKDATGGLLRQIGARGILVIKDVTSILAMNRDTRAALLAACREIHDGHWTRVVGAEGGRSLSWQGRIVVIGACTTAWDTHHEVIASLGDRFIVVRLDSAQMEGRYAAGRRAIANTGHEETMRAELSAVVGGLLAGVTGTGLTLTHDEQERILAAANVVTLGRTGVTYDYRGDCIDAHAPEAPTRFAKELTQIVRGAVAIGVDRPAALRLAIRCARDSMPPLRLAIIEDIAQYPGAATKDVRQRLGKPRATVDRQLQALHMLGVLTCHEEDGLHRGQPVTLWRYQLADGIDPDVLDPDSVPD